MRKRHAHRARLRCGRLEAPCVMLEGAHFLTRERGPEVCQLLRHIILHGALASVAHAGFCRMAVNLRDKLLVCIQNDSCISR